MARGDLGYLNRKLAARSSIAQAQTIEIAKDAVRAVDRAFRSWYKSFIDMPKKKTYGWYRLAAEKRLEKLDPLIFTVISKRLLSAAYWGWDASWQIMIDTLPVVYWQFLKGSRELQEGVSFKGSKAKEYSFYRPPNKGTVDRILKRPPASAKDGLNWQERLHRLSRHSKDKDNIAATLADSLSRGVNPRVAAKKILPSVNRYKAGSERIARTEMLRVSHEMQREGWDGFSDVIAGFVILATFDDRTRPHHAARHGDFYAEPDEKGNIPDNAVGAASERPIVPDEPNCRCHEAPKVKEMAGWAEDVLAKDRVYASMDGPVEDPGTFANWFDELGPRQQRRIVGPQRWRLVDKRLPQHENPLWADFIDPSDGMIVKTRRLKGETTAQFMARRKTNINRIAKQSVVHQQEIVAKAGAPDAPTVFGSKVVGEADVSVTGGVSVSKVYELEDGSKILFKAASGEAPDQRATIFQGTYFKREVAASRVSQIVDMDDLIPSAEFATIGGEEGVAVRWVKNAPTFAEVSDDLLPTSFSDRQRAFVFDFVMGNTDRNVGNLLAEVPGRRAKLWLVDHGLILPVEEGDELVQALFDVLDDQQRRAAIPKNVVAKFADNWVEIEETLRAAGIEDEAIDFASNRLKVLQGLDTLDDIEQYTIRTMEEFWGFE